MDQATAVFDDSDQAGVHDLQGTAHRRAAVRGLAEPDQGADRDRGSAVLRAPRLRPRPHRLGGARQPAARADRAGRQHDHAAARAAELSDAGQDLPPQAAGADSRRAHRADVHEAANPRAVSEQGVFRRRPVRRRGGVARLLRQARVRADGAGGGAARRPGEVAVELRADGQHGARASRGATSCCRRCSTTGAIDRRDVASSARGTSRSLCTTACAPTSRTGSTSRSRSGSELVERFGWQRVYQGGLRVFSTIDMPMQHAAEAAVADATEGDRGAPRGAAQARRARPRRRPRRRPEPATAAGGARSRSIPRTGHVRAMVGGRDFDESHFNRAVQAHRQPGSAFKPFVYAAALEAGYTPATVIDHLNDPIATLQGAWTPEDEHSTRRLDEPAHRRCARRAIAPRCACCRRSAFRSTVQYAKTMGVGDVPSVPSLALGSGEVTLQSMTAAYAAFANHGDRAAADADSPRRGSRRPACCTRRRTPSTRAISDTTAFLMSSMLADVINAGTGARARQPRLHAAGGRQDRHDQRLQRRLVRRLHAEARRPASGSASISRARFCRTDSPPTSPCRCGRTFMKAATQGRQAGVVHAAGRTSRPRRSAACPASSRPKAARTSRSSTNDGQLERRSMVYTEYFARGTEPTALLRSAPDARHHRQARRRSSPATRSRLPPRIERDRPAAGRRRRPAAPQPAPATDTSSRRRSRRRRSAASGRGSSASARTTADDVAGQRADEEEGRLGRSDTMRLDGALCRFGTSSVTGRLIALLSRSVAARRRCRRA